MAPVLDEQSRRRFVASEAKVLGPGGVSLMPRITLARSPIYYGLSDIRDKRRPCYPTNQSEKRLTREVRALGWAA